MRKPTIKVSWNMWRAWDVNVDGKNYHHQSKTNAYNQYNAAMKVYKKRKKKFITKYK